MLNLPVVDINQSSIPARPAIRRASWWVADVLRWFVSAFVLNFVLFHGTDFGWLPRLALIGALFLLIARSKTWTVLLTIQLSILVREPSRRDLFSTWETLAMCIGTLGLVAYVSSSDSTRRHLAHGVDRLLTRREEEPNASSEDESSPAVVGGVERSSFFSVQSSSESIDRPWAFLAYRGLALSGIAMLAMLAWFELPLTRAAREQWWASSVANAQTLWPGPTILVIATAMVVLMWYRGWRQMSRSQASMTLRSTLLSSTYRDLRMIVHRRRRARAKQGAHKVPTTKQVPT